jgi:hypothetical protein
MDDALRARLSSAARSKIEREFDTSIVVSRVEEIYRSLAQLPKASGQR